MIHNMVNNRADIIRSEFIVSSSQRYQANNIYLGIEHANVNYRLYMFAMLIILLLFHAFFVYYFSIKFCYIMNSIFLQVKIRPVFWGLTLQFIFGLLIIRWPPGYVAFRFLGDQVKTFLDYTDVGSEFVFTNTDMHPVVFKVRTNK